MRYAWDLQNQYLADAGLTHGLKGFLARALLHYIRIWDLRTVPGVDHFIANSHFVAERIWKHYKREAAVIHPPCGGQPLHPPAPKTGLLPLRLAPRALQES